MHYLLSSPHLIISNLAASILLVSIFYIFHPRKYDTILIFVVWNLIGLIVRYFVERDIWVGTWFGLFAVFSLMHFRESYHTFTMVYLFAWLSLGLLSSLMPSSDYLSFVLMAVVVLVLLLFFELVLKWTKKVIYTLPVSELDNLKEKALKELSAKKIKEMNVQSISKGKAKVTVTYTK